MAASLEWQSWAKGPWAALSNANPFSFPHLCPTSWEFNFHLNRGSQHSKEFSLEWVMLRDYIGFLNPKRTSHLKGQDLKRIKWSKNYKKALLSIDFIWKEEWAQCSLLLHCYVSPALFPLHAEAYSEFQSLSLTSTDLQSHDLHFTYTSHHVTCLFSLKSLQAGTMCPHEIGTWCVCWSRGPEKVHL